MNSNSPSHANGSLLDNFFLNSGAFEVVCVFKRVLHILKFFDGYVVVIVVVTKTI